MRGFRFLAFLLAGFFPLQFLLAEEAAVDVQVTADRPRPASNDVIRLTYTFSGPGSGGSIRAPMPLPLKNLVLVGGPSSSTQVTFFNGELKRSVALTYYVRPQKEGQAEVTETTWGIGDKMVKAAAYLFEVGPARSQPAQNEPDPDDPFSSFFGQRRAGIPSQQVGTSPQQRQAIVEYVATPEKSAAYVGEEVTIRYDLLTQVDVTGLEYAEPPKFPGLWAEDVERPEKPQGVRDTYQGHNVLRFTLLKKAVSGLSPGTVTIPPSTVKLQVRGGGDPFSDPFGWMRPQIVERSTKPIELKVLPIPGAADFHGPVGRFDLAAKIDKNKVAAGDALTLRVRLAGNGSLRTVTEPPKLEVKNARLYPPTSKTDAGKGKSGAIEWSYVIVPSEAGTLTIPPITIDTFDPAEKKRTTKATAPIAVLVEPGAAGTPGAGATGNAVTELPTPMPVAEPKSRSAAVAAGPRATTSGTPIDLSHGTVTVPLWVLGAIPAVLLVGVATAVVARQRSRTKGALAAAIAPEAGETKERAASRIDRALRDALSRKYAVPEGTSSAALLEALSNAGAPAALIGEVRSLTEDLDFLRYAPQLGEYDARIADARRKARRLLPKIS
ncbi:MAG TPA: BatD family protein [Thermoanaerobaculia bacterium]|nr:BatD family protein [Thermoanaerobaculia bacterium]